MAILAKIMDLIFHGEHHEEAAPSRAREALDRGGVAPASKEPVNIEQTLTELGEKTGATDWRHSIVDLMKCFGYDASLENRIELAKELGYQGSIDLDNTAEMNMWLHKTLMQKIAEQGGRLELKK